MEIVSTSLGLCRIQDGQAFVLDTAYKRLQDMLSATGSLSDLQTAPSIATVSIEEAMTHAISPARHSRAIWGVGLNYYSKVLATGRAVPTEPIFFLVPPNAVAESGADIPYPDGCTTELDYEAEIAVLVGRTIYRTDPRDIWQHIAAITAANDITARDVMRQTGSPVLAKSFYRCKPIGPTIRTVDDIDEMQSMNVKSYVNGELRQDDSSAGMIWSIAELLSKLSWFSSIEPGDMFLSGTPSGTGQDRKTFLEAGDQIEIHVSGIRPLTSSITHSELTLDAPIAIA